MSILEQVRQARAKHQVERVSKEPVKPKMSPQEALAVFGYTEFREGQEEVIEAVMGDADGVMAVFPTGHGKSLIYQAASLMSEHLTIVVSPLIALMKDQVDSLQKIGIQAVFINSTLSEEEVELTLAGVSAGGVKALYIAPERFKNQRFNKFISKLDIGIFAIDEAHCISRWGHDFRPSYAQLGGVIEKLEPRQVVALTATATERVRDDICESLGIPNAKKFVRGVFRSNLQLAVQRTYGSKMESIAFVAKEYANIGQETGIIYTATRKDAEAICEHLTLSGVKASFYHAGLTGNERNDIQERWAKDGGTIVATCAFGMGIDKSDVRFVVHSGLSQSIEDWYQEIGRAGRDGKDSLCVTFCDFEADYRTQMFLIDLTNPSGTDIKKFWEWIREEAKSVAGPNDEKVEVKMTQKVMGEHSGSKNVGGCIAYLKKTGLVKTLGRGKYEVVVNKDTFFKAEDMDILRQERIDKLNEVANFYRTKECRAAYVCRYFGDETFSGECGICDNCTS